MTKPTRIQLDTAFTRVGRADDAVVLLNIGLRDAADTRDISVHEALRALSGRDVGIFDAVVVQSDTERTLVIRGVTHASMYDIHAVSDDLEQDCIAVWNVDEQSGELVGPNWASWYRFDPSRFFVLDGERLDSALEAEG